MKLTLVRGLPGSGKSTYAKKLGVFHVEADMFCMMDGEYVFDGTKHRENHKTCMTMTYLCLSSGADCVVSNTFTQKWELDPYIKMANALGAELEIIRLSGSFGSIHNVPIDTIKTMQTRFEDVGGELFK
jgi:predicted kinase